jgi:SAM-dependent methyltransferase
MNHQSSNYAKHETKNPLQKWLIKRFHANIIYLSKKTNAKFIFEAGCGEGFSSRQIISIGCSKFIGLDINLESVFMAQNKCPTCSFLQGDILNLPFSDSIFDLVVSLEVLEHLEEPFAALDELCRVSREWLILSVPNEPFFCLANFMRGKNLNRWGNDPGHINHWNKRSFVNFVERRCVVIEKTLSFPWIILLCRIK